MITVMLQDGRAYRLQDINALLRARDGTILVTCFSHFSGKLSDVKISTDTQYDVLWEEYKANCDAHGFAAAKEFTTSVSLKEINDKLLLHGTRILVVEVESSTDMLHDAMLDDYTNYCAPFDESV